VTVDTEPDTVMRLVTNEVIVLWTWLAVSVLALAAGYEADGSPEYEARDDADGP
jgi:hypothetical protein